HILRAVCVDLHTGDSVSAFRFGRGSDFNAQLRESRGHNTDKSLAALSPLSAVRLDDVLHPAKLKVLLFQTSQTAEAHVHADLGDRELHVFQKAHEWHGHVTHGHDVSGHKFEA